MSMSGFQFDPDNPDSFDLVEDVGNSFMGTSMFCRFLRGQSVSHTGTLFKAGTIVVSESLGIRISSCRVLRAFSMLNCQTRPDSSTDIIRNTAGYAPTVFELNGVLSFLDSFARIGDGVEFQGLAGDAISLNNSAVGLGAIAGSGTTGDVVSMVSGSLLEIKDGNPPTCTSSGSDVDCAGTTSTFAAIDLGTPLVVSAEACLAKEV
jgi:hypothetical protein